MIAPTARRGVVAEQAKVISRTSDATYLQWPCGCTARVRRELVSFEQRNRSGWRRFYKHVVESAWRCAQHSTQDTPAHDRASWPQEVRDA